MQNGNNDICVKSEKRYITYFILVLSSFLMCLLFSFGTSFLYNYSDGDSSIFKAIGKLWSKGLIPYVDCFDHKGPFVFFLEYLGYTIHGERIGIFIVQFLFMLTSSIGIFKIIDTLTVRYSLILSVICVASINFYYEGGNLTEEYCLPFLIWSLYFVLKYLENSEESEHKPLYAFFYGITFMVGVLTRITNALPVCCGIFIIFIRLIVNKKWKNILHNILMFILGNIVFVLPFIIYFIHKNALYDMIYGTVIYNFKYATAGGNDFSKVVLKQVIPLCLIMMVGIIGLVKDRAYRYIYSMLIIMIGLAVVMQCFGQPYAHYLMIWIPSIVVGMGCLERLYLLFAKEKLKKNVIVCVFVIFLVFVGAKNVKLLMDAYHIYNDKTTLVFEQLSNDIVRDVKDGEAVIAYNVPANFYLCTDIKPCYRFFILQDWQTSKDLEMYKEFREDILSKRAKYIVVKVSGANTLDEEIHKNYEVVRQNDMFKLLQLK